jgi:gliding motility-associated-like protein
VYSLSVTSTDGCTALAKEEVDIFYDLLMPNAFTPDGDGVNDIFRVPQSISTTVDKFLVFNRWGQEVFSAKGREGWDGRLNGKDEPGGTYVWLVAYYDPITKKHVMKKGTVELIR